MSECRQVLGVPVGALLHGDEPTCGREADRYIVRDGVLLAVTCARHSTTFARRGYTVVIPPALPYQVVPHG